MAFQSTKWRVMIDLAKIQDEQKEWELKNFPSATWWQNLIGVQEELGELSHAALKSSQKIRGSEEKHHEDMRDAIGDLLIYLMAFCTKNNISLESAIQDTWNIVKNRDWVEDPITGGNHTHEV